MQSSITWMAKLVGCWGCPPWQQRWKGSQGYSGPCTMLGPSTVPWQAPGTKPLLRSPLLFPPGVRVVIYSQPQQRRGLGEEQGRRGKGGRRASVCRPERAGCRERPAAAIAGGHGQLMGETKGEGAVTAKPQAKPALRRPARGKRCLVLPAVPNWRDGMEWGANQPEPGRPSPGTCPKENWSKQIARPKIKHKSLRGKKKIPKGTKVVGFFPTCIFFNEVKNKNKRKKHSTDAVGLAQITLVHGGTEVPMPRAATAASRPPMPPHRGPHAMGSHGSQLPPTPPPRGQPKKEADEKRESAWWIQHKQRENSRAAAQAGLYPGVGEPARVK